MRVAKPNRSAGWQLTAYLLLRPLLQPLMRGALKRRVRRGKDDPQRSPEKRGITASPRPDGTLVWVHAVGLGEVLALRPLLEAMAQQAPQVSFLITSTARSSGQVIGDNLPPNSRHQFLPLDGPLFVRRFLDHWQPDLAIWSEQDLWPGAIYDTAKRGIPMAYINARLTERSFKRRVRFGGLYKDIFRRFELICAQDMETVRFLGALGADAPRLTMSLKPAAQPLHVDANALGHVQKALAGRRVWVAASTHQGDEAIVLAAHAIVRKVAPETLLILVPRVPDRAEDVCTEIAAHGLTGLRRSAGGLPQPDHDVWLGDGFGELGLWYRLADVAFVGGSFSGVGGHNPWEPVCLGVPVLYGSDVQNFRRDYADLTAAGLAQQVAHAPQSLAQAVMQSWDAENGADVQALVAKARKAIFPLARDLLALIKPRP